MYNSFNIGDFNHLRKKKNCVFNQYSMLIVFLRNPYNGKIMFRGAAQDRY